VGAARPWQVNAENLITIFAEAGCKSEPEYEDASYSVTHLGYGCRMGKQTKHWCGIFATCVWKYTRGSMRLALHHRGKHLQAAHQQ